MGRIARAVMLWAGLCLPGLPSAAAVEAPEAADVVEKPRPVEEMSEPAGPPAPEADGDPRTDAPEVLCDDPGADGAAFIDRFQRGVYTGVCGAAQWVDGLFGNPRFDQDSDETYGRLQLFERWDRYDGLDTRLRLRARLALPAMENRLRLFIGRGDEKELIDEQPVENQTPLPASFTQVEDEAWLLGLGYSKQGALENGFDFGAGARVRTPIDPYVKGTYRHNFVFDSRTMLRFRETVFWRDSRGLGSTTEITLDRLVRPQLLGRWHNTFTVADDTQAMGWASYASAYRSLSNRRAIAVTALAGGQTGADVPLQNYGVETRYRQRVWRRWLFIEFLASVTWPRETLEEKREINPGFGIGFEMYFGPVPDVQMY